MGAHFPLLGVQARIARYLWEYITKIGNISFIEWSQHFRYWSIFSVTFSLAASPYLISPPSMHPPKRGWVQEWWYTSHGDYKITWYSWHAKKMQKKCHKSKDNCNVKFQPHPTEKKLSNKNTEIIGHFAIYEVSFSRFSSRQWGSWSNRHHRRMWLFNPMWDTKFDAFTFSFENILMHTIFTPCRNKFSMSNIFHKNFEYKNWNLRLQLLSRPFQYFLRI